MASIDRTDPAVKGLFDLAKQLSKKDKDDITIGEIRRALDTNRDSFISAGDNNFDLVNKMIGVPVDSIVGMSEADVEKIRKAQAALQIAVNDSTKKLKPADDLGNYKTANLIIDPYELSDASMMTKWSSMRKSFAAQTVSVNSNQAKNSVANILSRNGNNMAGLVNTLWNNPDSVGGISSKVIRMDELIGVFQHAQAMGNQEAFLNNFATEFGKSLNDPALGLDPQFVLDSLLEVIQSTDFNTLPPRFKNFMKNMVKGILENTNALKDKTGVVGNYDGTRDGGVFGSLAVVKKDDGSIEFIEHDPSDASLKTKYSFVDAGGVPGFGGDAGAPKARAAGGLAAGGVDDAGAAGDNAVEDPEKLQNELDTIQGKFDNPDGLVKKLKAPGADPAKLTVFNEKSEKLGVSIPQLISSKDINSLSDLIDALKTISNIADINGQPKLKDQINSLIVKLANQLDKLKAEVERAAPPPTSETPAPPPTSETPVPPTTRTPVPGGEAPAKTLIRLDILQERLGRVIFDLSLGNSDLLFGIARNDDKDEKDKEHGILSDGKKYLEEINIQALIEKKDISKLEKLIDYLSKLQKLAEKYNDNGIKEDIQKVISGLQPYLDKFNASKTETEQSDTKPPVAKPTTETPAPPPESKTPASKGEETYEDRLRKVLNGRKEAEFGEGDKQYIVIETDDGRIFTSKKGTGIYRSPDINDTTIYDRNGNEVKFDSEGKPIKAESPIPDKKIKPSREGEVKVKFNSKGNLITDSHDLFVKRTIEGKTRWYSINDKDSERPYDLTNKTEGRYSFLKPGWTPEAKKATPSKTETAMPSPRRAPPINSPKPSPSNVSQADEVETKKPKVKQKAVVYRFDPRSIKLLTYRLSDQDGKLAFNMNEYGKPVYDMQDYPPGGGENNPFYFHAHRTAVGMLKQAGIKVFYESYDRNGDLVDYQSGEKLVKVRIEFTKPGVYNVGGQTITVTEADLSEENKPRQLLTENNIEILSKSKNLEDALKSYSDDALVEMFTKFSNKNRALLLDGLSEEKQLALLKNLSEDVSTNFLEYLDGLGSTEST